MPVTVGKPGTKPVKIDVPKTSVAPEKPLVKTFAPPPMDIPAPTVVLGSPKKTVPVAKAPPAGAQLVAVPKKVSELAALIAQIQKDKGDKIVYRGRDVPNVIRLPTGDFEFDFNTGGGFPRGRISLIYGPESSCKTTMALRAAAIAQRGPEGYNKAVFIDVEHAFDGPRAEELGVNVDELIVIKPSYGEEAADITIGMVGAEDVAIVILDSLAAMISTAEVDKSLDKFDVGTSAILIKRMTNKINIQLLLEAKRDHYPAVIFINQIRYKVGVVFGNPETTPGGKNPHFISALTLRVTGKNKIVGAVNPDKPSFKELSFDIIKAKIGIVRSHFEFDMAMIAHGDLLAGESKSWGLVKDELQAAGLLVAGPKGKGWVLDGLTFPTQKVIEDTYYADVDYSLHLQKMVIDNYKGEKTVFDNTKAFIAQYNPDTSDGPPPEAGMMFQDKQPI
jgi:recombination protein RecA